MSSPSAVLPPITHRRCFVLPDTDGVPLTQRRAGVHFEFVLAEAEQEAGLSHRGVSGQHDPVGLLRGHVAQVRGLVLFLRGRWEGEEERKRRWLKEKLLWGFLLLYQ